MAKTGRHKKPEGSMVQLNLRLPRAVYERLTRRAAELSERTGLQVVPSVMARAILQEHV